MHTRQNLALKMKEQLQLKWHHKLFVNFSAFQRCLSEELLDNIVKDIQKCIMNFICQK